MTFCDNKEIWNCISAPANTGSSSDATTEDAWPQGGGGKGRGCLGRQPPKSILLVTCWEVPGAVKSAGQLSDPYNSLLIML